MPDLSALASPAPYHIIAYGNLLGTSIWQSFFNGLISFQSLPRPQFATLQTALTPWYFGVQTVTSVLLAATFPAERTAIGSTPASFAGVFHESNRLHVLTPIAIVFLSSAVNWGYLGPTTTQVMRQRKHQETRDGKKSHDAGPHSAEMEKLNQKFNFLHSASALINIGGILAMMWYGAYLGERLL